MVKIILLALVVATLEGCAGAAYSHRAPSGEERSIYAVAFGTTTAIEDLKWRIGDSDMQIGKAGQQQPIDYEGLGKLLGTAAKTVAK